jgi:hypothetical protein
MLLCGCSPGWTLLSAGRSTQDAAAGQRPCIVHHSLPRDVSVVIAIGKSLEDLRLNAGAGGLASARFA